MSDFAAFLIMLGLIAISMNLNDITVTHSDCVEASEKPKEVGE